MGSSSGRRRVRLTEAPLCLRRARRQAQAAFGGRFAKLDPCARLRPFSTIGLDAANRPVGPDLCVEAYGETTPRRIGAVTAKRPKRSGRSAPQGALDGDEAAWLRPAAPRVPQTRGVHEPFGRGKKTSVGAASASITIKQLK